MEQILEKRKVFYKEICEKGNNGNFIAKKSFFLFIEINFFNCFLKKKLMIAVKKVMDNKILKMVSSLELRPKKTRA